MKERGNEGEWGGWEVKVQGLSTGQWVTSVEYRIWHFWSGVASQAQHDQRGQGWGQKKDTREELTGTVEKREGSDGSRSGLKVQVAENKGLM